MVLGFAGAIAAAAAWTIWGPNSMFPADEDPQGGLFNQSLSYFFGR
jgi:hypothetical protein